MRFLFSILFISLSTIAFAKGKKDHVNDMRRIFPFTNKTPNIKIIDFYLEVTNHIDHPYDNYNHPIFLSEDSIFKNIQWGNHRLWFHWGFNQNPRDYGPLKPYLRDNSLTQEDINIFWEKLDVDINIRKKKLLKDAAKVFGYNESDNKLNALVTILYSIHLVGDCEKGSTEIGFIELNKVIDDIYDAIDKLAGNNYNNKIAVKELKNELGPFKGDDPKYPCNFLNEMAKHFSEFFLELSNGEYKDKFEKMGYVYHDEDIINTAYKNFAIEHCP